MIFALDIDAIAFRAEAEFKVNPIFSFVLEAKALANLGQASGNALLGRQFVDRLLAALGRENRRQRATQQSGKVSFGESPRLIGANADDKAETHSPYPPQESSSRERYFQMWQQYSEEVNCSNSAELDFKVGRRAFEAGMGQKEIALMLAAVSPTVKQMVRGQRKAQAMKSVNRVAQLSCQRRQRQTQSNMNRNQQMGLGD